MAKSRERGVSTAAGQYEILRQKRIKQNAERMHQLGLFDLSSKLKSQSNKISKKKKISSSPGKRQKPSHPLSEPLRRSFRLHNLPPVRDIELHPEVKEEPELYTEEHEQLLGDCKIAWTPSVDDCGEYRDQVGGKLCHQCSRRTLGHYTHCSKCSLVQGQICGDCLYKRYGENVIEAKQNSNWICPVCRGICNCCRCRRSKGWSMLGPIYKKVVSLGYKSVAHYLIQTRRGQAILKGEKMPNESISRASSGEEGSMEISGKWCSKFQPFVDHLMQD